MQREMYCHLQWLVKKGVQYLKVKQIPAASGSSLVRKAQRELPRTFAMVQRYALPRKNSYHTKSNKAQFYKPFGM